MSLLSSRVPRSLDKKFKVFGFELGDLLLIFLYLAFSNLVFGTTRLKFPLVWAGTPLIAGILYFAKRNQPDDYLQHWGEYYRSPRLFTAGKSDIEYRPYFFKEENE